MINEALATTENSFSFSLFATPKGNHRSLTHPGLSAAAFCQKYHLLGTPGDPLVTPEEGAEPIEMNPGERTATDSYHNLVYHDRLKIQQFQGNTDVIIAAEVSKIRPGMPFDPSTITKERGRYKDEYGDIPYCVIKAEHLARKSHKAKGRKCIMEKNPVLVREFLYLSFNRESCETIAESLTTDEQYAGTGFPKTLCANTLESWLLRETDRGSVLWNWL